jgi:hypothetical protein
MRARFLRVGPPDVVEAERVGTHGVVACSLHGGPPFGPLVLVKMGEHL